MWHFPALVDELCVDAMADQSPLIALQRWENTDPPIRTRPHVCDYVPDNDMPIAPGCELKAGQAIGRRIPGQNTAGRRKLGRQGRMYAIDQRALASSWLYGMVFGVDHCAVSYTQTYTMANKSAITDPVKQVYHLFHPFQ
jgi:hypothetical protein